MADLSDIIHILPSMKSGADLFSALEVLLISFLVIALWSLCNSCISTKSFPLKRDSIKVNSV